MIAVLARAKESMRPLAIYESGAYDFSKIRGRIVDYSMTGAGIRTHIFDTLAREFLQQHPDAVVVNLGAGLDARFERVDTGHLQWVDIDLPGIITIRKALFEETDRRRTRALDVTALGWPEQIKKEDWFTRGNPVLIIAEGMIPYIPESGLKDLLNQMAQRFPGAEFIFDCVGTLVSRKQRKHPALKSMEENVVIEFGLDNFATLSKMVKELQLVNCYNYYDKPVYRKRWGFFGNLFASIPLLRRQFLIWRVKFP